MQCYDSDRQASAEILEDEIEVTPEMIEAGVSELIGVIDCEIDENVRDVAIRVYRSMVLACPFGSVRRKNFPQH